MHQRPHYASDLPNIWDDNIPPPGHQNIDFFTSIEPVPDRTKNMYFHDFWRKSLIPSAQIRQKRVVQVKTTPFPRGVPSVPADNVLSTGMEVGARGLVLEVVVRSWIFEDFEKKRGGGSGTTTCGPIGPLPPTYRPVRPKRRQRGNAASVLKAARTLLRLDTPLCGAPRALDAEHARRNRVGPGLVEPHDRRKLRRATKFALRFALRFTLRFVVRFRSFQRREIIERDFVYVVRPGSCV